jgi:hypothetical protein
VAVLITLYLLLEDQIFFWKDRETMLLSYYSHVKQCNHTDRATAIAVSTVSSKPTRVDLSLTLPSLVRERLSSHQNNESWVYETSSASVLLKESSDRRLYTSSKYSSLGGWLRHVTIQHRLNFLYNLCV